MTLSKRLMDITISLLLAALLWPVLGVLVIILALSEGRPIFYISERMKTPTQGFSLIKLRTMKPSAEKSTIAKLNKVNRFFNMFRFVDDKTLWGVSNYWATPLEFIGVNGGDCEDYSIAKYFTLLELGVPDDKMRITMVKSLTLNQYHMVLAYYDTPSAMPLILDNLDGVIKPASQRNDLMPVYSFNASRLWLNKDKGRGILSGKSSKLTLWQNLRQRMTTSKLKQPKHKMEF